MWGSIFSTIWGERNGENVGSHSQAAAMSQSPISFASSPRFKVSPVPSWPRELAPQHFTWEISQAHIQKTRIFKSSQTELLEAAWWTAHGSKHIKKKKYTSWWDEHPFTVPSIYQVFWLPTPGCLKNPEMGPLRWSAAHSYDGIRWWCSAQLRPARPSPGRNQKRLGEPSDFFAEHRLGDAGKLEIPKTIGKSITITLDIRNK